MSPYFSARGLAITPGRFVDEQAVESNLDLEPSRILHVEGHRLVIEVAAKAPGDGEPGLIGTVEGQRRADQVR